MDGEDSKIANARNRVSQSFLRLLDDKTKVQYTAVWSAAKIAFDHVIALISANGQSNAAATEEVVSPMQQTLTPNER